MTYKEGKCTANCGFCPQARSYQGSEGMLSRVNWPVFPFKEFLTKLKYMRSSQKFERICIQTLNYPNNMKDLIQIITQIRNSTHIPISVAIPPISQEYLKELKLIGVERVGIALDGTTPEVFDNIKGIGVNGPYKWNNHINTLMEALKIYSEGFVSTHLIIGLGEKEQDVIERIEELHNLKILISLFAFTPIKGTLLETNNQPSLLTFRKLQLGRYLIVEKGKYLEDFTFNMKGSIININISKQDLRDIIDNTKAFFTSGCPGCNRPYYTSKPSGPIYNYPRSLIKREKDEIYELLYKIVN
jgi:biotin synthase